MKFTALPLQNAEQTARQMYRLSRRYYADMVPYAHLSFPEMYETIKNIPYRFDPPRVEYVKRPEYTINGIGGGGDCDDKSVCVGAWCHLMDIPFRFVGVGRRIPGKKYRKNEKINLQHVFCVVNINNGWILCDPTYSFNTLGRIRGGYERLVIFKP
jgi:hypothetical protein